MIGSLVRWFRRQPAPGRSRPVAGAARRVTPRLEALEGRAVPAALVAGHAPLIGDVAGGPALARSIGVGEEMPALIRRGGEDMPALTHLPGAGAVSGAGHGAAR